MASRTIFGLHRPNITGRAKTSRSHSRRKEGKALARASRPRRRRRAIVEGATFLVAGCGGRDELLFRRDATGTVTAYISRRNKQDIVWASGSCEATVAGRKSVDDFEGGKLSRRRIGAAIVPTVCGHTSIKCPSASSRAALRPGRWKNKASARRH